MTSFELTSTIVDFLRSIGISVRTRALDAGTFLPGILVDGDEIVYDAEALASPGDLLHEAGHLAVLPPDERTAADGDFGDNPGAEMGAIAWSYAAAVHLDVPVDVLFHDEGYKGDAQALQDNFSAGRYLGVPILQWRGLTTQEAYPEMDIWMCKAG